MSVIEREFTRGIVEAKDTKLDCLAFVRVIHSISYADMQKVGRFLDTVKDGSVDKVTFNNAKSRTSHNTPQPLTLITFLPA